MANVMVKITAAVRGTQPSNIITTNHLKPLQSLDSGLRACELKASRATLKSHSEATVFMTFGKRGGYT